MTKAILILGPSWVGDMIMTHTLIQIVHSRYPDHAIDLLAPKWCLAVGQHMQPIRQLIELPFGHGQLKLKERFEFAKGLRGQYERCYIIPNSFKSALIPFWAKIPHRVAWTGEMRGLLLNHHQRLNKKDYPLMIQRLAQMGYDFDHPLPDKVPYPKLSCSQQQSAEALTEFNLNLNRQVVALCPGAEFGPSKQWPIEKYQSVAKRMIEQGHQVWIFGSPSDFEVAQAIASPLGEHAINLASKTTLPQAIALMNLSKAVVSNDSGLMHIGCALSKPVVAVFGSSSPDFTPPLSKRVMVHRQSLECSPCFKRECPLSHHQCMKSLEVTPVIDTLNRWLA